MTTPRFEALLVTGATETSYHRAGAGAPVLLLFPGGLADPLGARLFERLADRFRVIAPVQPAEVGKGGAVPVSKWLRDLVDGLGLVRASIVADEPCAGAALGFALMELERVAGVVAVCRDPADPARPVGVVEDRLQHSAHGLLVVSVDPAGDLARGAAAAVHQMVPFLEMQEHRARE